MLHFNTITNFEGIWTKSVCKEPKAFFNLKLHRGEENVMEA